MQQQNGPIQYIKYLLRNINKFDRFDVLLMISEMIRIERQFSDAQDILNSLMQEFIYHCENKSENIVNIYYCYIYQN